MNLLICKTILIFIFITLINCDNTVEGEDPVSLSDLGEMIFIEAKGKSFIAGSDDIYDSNEKPSHGVMFSYNFNISKTEITQRDFKKLISAYYPDFNFTSWYNEGDDYPAYSISWYDAVLYCNARSKLNNLDTIYVYDSISYKFVGVKLYNLKINMGTRGFRLPTGAEWEYSCRGGTTTDFYWGTDSSDARKYEWYSENSINSDGYAFPNYVGAKSANPFGLFDMPGNVAEWCNDYFEDYDSLDLQDPTGPLNGTQKSVHGGGYLFNANSLRSFQRLGQFPDSKPTWIGFRCVLSEEIPASWL